MTPPGKASPTTTTADNNNVTQSDVKCEELLAVTELNRKKKVELVDAEANTVLSGKF